jgi:hypothetical protein
VGERQGLTAVERAAAAAAGGGGDGASSVAGGTGESSRGLAVGGMGQGVSEQEDVATAGDVCVL